MKEIQFKFKTYGSVFLTLLVATLFFFESLLIVSAATIEYKGYCTIVLNGEIDKFTDVNLKKCYESSKMKCSEPLLKLNSNGGDVDAAMRAGNYIRDKQFETWIEGNASCASACVLLFLGGVNRVALGGQIGLHRPYSEQYSMSESESRASYDKINRRIIQYLNRMNIPEGILNKMNSVSPGEIKWLVPADNDDFLQLQELQIIGKDPVFEEQKDSAMAKRLGITKGEYYIRVQRANEICPSFYQPGDSPRERKERAESYGKCHWDVMYGRR